MPTPSSYDPFADLDMDPHARAIAEDMDQREALIDDLTRRRRSLGLNQTVVAKRMGVGQSTVSEFENEATDPRLSTLQRYARAVDACVSVRLRFNDARDEHERRLRNQKWLRRASEEAGQTPAERLTASFGADIIYLTRSTSTVRAAEHARPSGGARVAN